MPGFDVQLRRNKRRNRRPVPEADTGNITAENSIVPMVNMMVTGMARCGDGSDFKRGHRDDRFVFQDSVAYFRDGCDSAPHSLHVVAADSCSGRYQLGGVNQLLSSEG